MKLSELRDSRDVLAERIENDPAFRKRWNDTALARELSTHVIRYRAENDLTQTELAAMVGMKQPQVARIEIGETMPSISTLTKFAPVLGIEFTITVKPADAESKNVKKSARKSAVADYTESGAEVVVLAA